MGETSQRAKRPVGRRHSWLVTAAAAVLVAAGACAVGEDAHHALNEAGTAGSSSAHRGAVATGHVLATREPGSPRLVRLPSLGVSSRVVPIRASDRTLVPPSDPELLGWWADGARPGDAHGSALVTGHTVHTGGGALDDLEDAGPGDRVVVRTDHDTLHYVVRHVRVYDKGALARRAEDVFSQDGPGRLVLATCEDWNGERYLSNVVVIARPLE